ncbi:MAG: rane protein [Glaciihabitans sp.]|nr:rane protein [Glaciihabitans sp.]
MSTSPAQPAKRSLGVGRLLIAVYAILALGATARSFVQIAEHFDRAPVAYLLSGLSGVVYIVATIALVKRGQIWYRIAWITITFELVGVLVVGTLSLVDAELFPSDSVWSYFGRGYGFIPLVLPILGMLWLLRNKPQPVVPAVAGV